MEESIKDLLKKYKKKLGETLIYRDDIINLPCYKDSAIYNSGKIGVYGEIVEDLEKLT